MRRGNDTSNGLKTRYILDNFDFRKVHTAMRSIDWQWQHGADGFKVPSTQRLFEVARRILTSVEDGETACISTGGFTAYIEDGILGLEFVLEVCNTEDMIT